MGALSCAGETVVDLYAGIGSFTLPLLVPSEGGWAAALGALRPEAGCLHANVKRTLNRLLGLTPRRCCA